MHPKPVAIIVLCVGLPALLNGCDGESARNDSQSNPTSRPARANDELARRVPVPITSPSFSSGDVELLPTPGDLVDTLNFVGEAGRARSIARLRAAGYAGGAVREQKGTRPVTLVRSYVFRLGSAANARMEVVASIAEVRPNTSLDYEEIPLRGVPTGRAFRTTLDIGRNATVPGVLIVFSAGRDVYGFQMASGVFPRADDRGGSPYEAQLTALATRLYATYGPNR
jgi:hypothetical protein